MKRERPHTGPSRREFLKGAGAAGAGLVAGSMGAGVAVAAPGAMASPSPSAASSPSASGAGAPVRRVDFGRIFADLPPFADANDTVRDALLEVGRQGGILDAQDDLAAGPKALDRRSDGQRQPDAHERVRNQSRQPDDDGGIDFRRPVHRSRHHVRSDLPAGGSAESGDLAEHPHPGARSGLRVRRRTRAPPRPVCRQPGRVGRAEAEDRQRRGARGRPAGGQRRWHVHAPCSATRATTRT